MQSKGWVKLWREQFTHEVSDRKPWCDGYAWSYLYSQANYKPGVMNFRNQYISIERGQFITSEFKLHEVFGWSRRRTNSFLTSLEVRGMCTIRRTSRFTMITICNYEKFQSTEDENETTDVTTDVTTDGQQMDTIKEVKEVKNTGRVKKEHDPRVKPFLKFWGETFLQATGSPYVFTFGKDGKLTKDLLHVHALEALHEVTKAYFRDEQAKREGFTFGQFKVAVNRLISKKAMGPLEQAKREIRGRRTETSVNSGFPGDSEG
jgi:hypothetical protein